MDFRPLLAEPLFLLGFPRFRSRLGPHFKVDFSDIFGGGFSGRTFDESSAKIEGGSLESWRR
jgi:hypothetical protein